MKFPLFRRRVRSDTISSLYGTIVAQARLPCFYREYGVPDTVNGRFDLLVLHLALFSTGWRMSRNCGNSGRRFSIISVRTWTIICAKWGSAIFQCPDTCIA